ncbi:TIGR03089 family protein [Actinomadura parmotrematis]|uniref:TIGR03089 family protein n=1 Tax=Actinomadura parmotrematis TaxID=2864039 RepID=A0ABS7FW20_9ACTN|nr:TIGR03089 family protein [Actinomadura parmotrematis]MBW8484623.1 TIGR03089 family protein [Actinomadura parmotrematis]
MTTSDPAGLLRHRVAADPARPLVTFYDDATGERIELSARTFDNWVAKTANLLVDGLAAEPGTPVVLVLPPHWQTAVWLMACWTAGAVAVPVWDAAGGGPAALAEAAGPAVTGGDSGDYIVVAAEEALADALAAFPDAAEVVGLSLHSLGGPLAAVPGGVTDYAAEVRGYGDRFAAATPINPDEPALVMTKITYSGAELVREARAAAAKWELDVQDRLLVDMPFVTWDGLLAGLLAPLISGSSAIIQRNPDEARRERRIALENVTAVAGAAGWNDASGSVRRLP